MPTAYETIANLVASYAYLTDAGDFASLGRLLDDADLSLNGGEPVHGAPAVQDLARSALQTYEDGTLKTRHVTTNLLIDVDEAAGTAIGRAYFVVFQALPDFPLQPIAVGHYRDRFAVIDNTWRFTERIVTTEFTGDVSHHVRADA